MEKALAQERIKELTELIEHYNYEYYMNDTSLISDHDIASYAFSGRYR